MLICHQGCIAGGGMTVRPAVASPRPRAAGGWWMGSEEAEPSSREELTVRRMGNDEKDRRKMKPHTPLEGQVTMPHVCLATAADSMGTSAR
jgi:hypothetical protein